jgi:hypothetical protein
MKHIKTFESFLNESNPNTDQMTYNEDPKSLLKFNESKGPYEAFIKVSDGTKDDQCGVRVGLIDKKLDTTWMTAEGPGFYVQFEKELGLSKNAQGPDNFNMSKNELVDLLKKNGFKLLGNGNHFVKKTRTPETGVKDVVAFFEPLVDKFNK